MPKAKEVEVKLPEIDFKTVEITLYGTSPLVTHPFPLKAMKQIEDKQMGVAKTTRHDIRQPWKDLGESLYWLTEPPAEFTEESITTAMNEGAVFGFHVGGVKDSAISAAVRRGLIKNAPMARGLFRILGTKQDYLYKKNCLAIKSTQPPVMRKDCLSTFSSGADMRYRPQFDEWSIDVTIEYDAGAITLEQLLMWFKLGGFACGLGENRAEKGEGWGSYTIETKQS